VLLVTLLSDVRYVCSLELVLLLPWKMCCDPEGGSLKAGASAYESQDSPLGDKRQVIRDARELVMFGREQLSKPSSKDFFAKEGHGVYRRFFTIFP
jgi:hypothetical protein